MRQIKIAVHTYIACDVGIQARKDHCALCEVLRNTRLYDKVAHRGWYGSCLLPTRGEGVWFPC